MFTNVLIVLAIVAIVKTSLFFRRNYKRNKQRALEMEKARKRFEFFANGA